MNMKQKRSKEKDNHNNIDLYKPYVPEIVSTGISEGKKSLPSERREVTVIFADITGFTRLADKLDPEEADAIIKKIFHPIVNIVNQYEGSINKFLGDGIMILFGASSSHENDYERAVRTSMEIQKSMDENGIIKIGNKEKRLKIRIGIHSGLCIAGEIGSSFRKEFTVIGDTVNLASRLQASSRPGRILVSDRTYQKVKEIFTFSPPRKIRIKGKKNLVKVHYLKNLNHLPKEKKKLSPFVGRKKEINLLKKSIKGLLNSKGKTIEIHGELGIGKTRLISELLKEGQDERYQVFSIHCNSWEKMTPYCAIKGLFSFLLEIKTENKRTIIAKIREKINNIDSSRIFALPYLIKLFSNEINLQGEVSSQSREEYRLFKRVIKGMIQAYSLKKPMIIIMEDVQWMDESSRELLTELDKTIDNQPILLLCTLREAHDREGFIDDAQKIKLGPLSIKNTQKLIEGLIKNREKLSHGIWEKMIATAGGNPLFTEEVVRTINENRIFFDKQKTIQSAVDSDGLDIPDTIQNIARERIDRLSISLKEILYKAAVLGMQFSSELLKNITQLDHLEFNKALSELIKKEFFIKIKNGEKKDIISFNHSLIQEVAYHRLLYKDRKVIHGQIGSIIERTYSHRLNAIVEELALHFKNSNLKEKAILYLMKAGDKSQSLYAFRNAVHFFSQCNKIINEMKSGVKDLARLAENYNKIGFAYNVLSHRKEAVDNLNQALKLSLACNDKEIESIILMNLGHFYGDIGNWDKAIHCLQKSLSANKENQNLKRKARIVKSIGLANIFKGDIRNGFNYLKQSLIIVKDIKDDMLHAMILNNMGIYFDMIGQWEQSIDFYRKSLIIYKKHNNIIQIANTMGNLGFAFFSINLLDKAKECFEESISFSEKTGDVYNEGINLLHLGEVYLKEKHFQKTNDFIQKAEEIFIGLKDKLGLADVYRVKALVFKQTKDKKEASRFFKKAIDIYHKYGDRLNEGESYYEWGEMLLSDRAYRSSRNKLTKAKHLLESIGTMKHRKEIKEKLEKMRN